jgi:hypothetical protein
VFSLKVALLRYDLLAIQSLKIKVEFDHYLYLHPLPWSLTKDRFLTFRKEPAGGRGNPSSSMMRFEMSLWRFSNPSLEDEAGFRGGLLLEEEGT